MTDEERNKIIAEALELCWHKWEYRSPISKTCTKCHGIFSDLEENPDFSTWPGFGIIVERGQKMSWWITFWCYLWDYEASSEDFLNVLMSGESFMRMLSYINPPIMFRELSTWLLENRAEMEELK